VNPPRLSRPADLRECAVSQPSRSPAPPPPAGGPSGLRAASGDVLAPPADSSVDVRERFADELLRAKLDALKELAYGASHEVNNPLANIALRATSLLKREDDPEKRKMLEAIHRSAMRAHEMISDLMLFARPPKAEKAAVALAEIAELVIDEHAALAADRSIRLSLHEQAPTPAVWADPTHVAIALRALVDNALEAVGHGGEVAVGVGALEHDPGFASLWVRDNGPGVPAEITPHVFDPFFSGREAGRGLGCGLSKGWRLVTDHGGSVRLTSSAARGVTVTMRWPLAERHP